MKHYDAIIIGAGQAGVPLAKKLALAGKKVALIEKRKVGGTCINDGCTPTKALVASAKLIYQAKNAAQLGIDIGSVKVNFKKIIERKNEIVTQFRESTERGIKETKGLKLYMGEASFTSTKIVSILANDGKEQLISSNLIFINTGAKTVIPKIEGLQTINYLTSTSILDLKKVPKHLLIIGGNYIGLEFGQMFKRFGSEVTIIEKDAKILKREDKEISTALTAILEDENIAILTNSKVKNVKLGLKNKVQVEVVVGKKTKSIVVSDVLVAVGRTPQTSALKLSLCGVKTDEKGYVIVNDKLETNVKGIYALGDVKAGPAFTHIAYNDFTIIYRNLIENKKLSKKGRLVPYCVYTDPQLGRIGITEQQAIDQKLKYKAVTFPMSFVGRAVETTETKGLMKAIVDLKTKKILGAAILGAEGGEVVSVLQMAMEGGLTWDKIRYGVFAHPTYTEALNNLFMKFDEKE